MGLNTLKMRYITDGDMSADIEGPWLDMLNLTKCSFGFTWSGTSPVGAVTVEASNDPDHSDATAVTLSSSLTVGEDTGTHLADLTEWSARYIRLKYTFTSGTGTAQAWATAKGDAN